VTYSTQAGHRHDAQELIDIAEVAQAAAKDVIGIPADRAPRAVDTTGANLAPLALGDRRFVRERLRHLVAEVLEHDSSLSGAVDNPLTVRVCVTADTALVVRLEAGAAWRELRLPVAGAAPLDAPRLSQIRRYGFLRVAAA
jgi:hypothetical protein